jgi:DNA mismatch endonuclease (patch repair protein)
MLSRGSNAHYWVAKIQGNRTRDRRVNLVLKQLGWRVVRVWESDVRDDAEKIARRISGLLSC